ncbi:MAG: glycoside hydrolase family 88 protein [Gracilimonas sp.]|nr:glycoside hydrolase family 88 protein [Gracilimonas sp.]
MKNDFSKFYSFIIVPSIVLLSVSCTSKKEVPKEVALADKQLRVLKNNADQQLKNVSESSEKPLVFPRSVENGEEIRFVSSSDWTSGFYPGTLWYMYDLTGDAHWKEAAERHTGLVEQEKLNSSDHDIGFKIYCSFGNGYRLTEDPHYRDVIIESAETLITRFNEKVGAIRSWDHNTDKWDFPVIIDNMMNLELLFRATEETGDSTFYDIAVTHANTTLEEHFREDNSSYHVIDFNPESGEVRKRNTHQGFEHESSWARGQAWGLYGFTMTYRFTKDTVYLDQAEKIAEYILNHPSIPDDMVPYWDYNAPNIPDEPKDVSAAVITASALFELSTFVTSDSESYQEKAENILNNVQQGYTSEVGENFGFLLDHSTGHYPKGSEINVPIIYADYYYLEAIKRGEGLVNNGEIN